MLRSGRERLIGFTVGRARNGGDPAMAGVREGVMEDIERATLFLHLDAERVP